MVSSYINSMNTNHSIVASVVAVIISDFLKMCLINEFPNCNFNHTHFHIVPNMEQLRVPIRLYPLYLTQ
jgi:hypothetical protein